MALRDSARHISDQQRVADDIKIANAEYALKVTAMSQQIAALDKGGKDYENKLKSLQDKQKQLTQQHENEITAIKDKAEMERNAKVLSAEQKFQGTITSGLTQSLMGHKSWASTMSSIGNEVVAGMIQNATQSIMAHKMTQVPDAAAAARAAYLEGVKIGGPMAPVVGALYGAEAFTAMMAFQGGGIVPGVGKGDIVPAMLEPGEGVVPGGVMDKLRGMARSGDMGGGGSHYHATTHVHMHVNALDGDGMDQVLNKHAGKIQKHFENSLRKMNR
jgi:hypothetical protein